MQRHPHAPHIIFRAVPGGFEVWDERTGARATTPSMAGVQQFAADHSRVSTHVPLGDAVHKLAAGLGFERCTPCAERQARMNRLIRW
jgi:hypothetical protein